MTNENNGEKHGERHLARRKIVKIIAGGVGALAGYTMLPVNWSKPFIEQVFLPAHAQTSLPENPDNPNPGVPCTQCGDQLLTDGIGVTPGWNSQLVLYSSAEKSYVFHDAGSIMSQYAVLSSSCVGTTLRLNFGDGGGTGPLRVSIAVGNTFKKTVYTGGGLVVDVPVPPGPTSPLLVVIQTDQLPLDTSTKIISPTLTVIC